MSEMSREEAIDCIRAIHVQMFNSGNSKWTKACAMAIEALTDNKPSRTWIAKNEYRRGWHDAITRALSEVLKIHVGNEIFDMVQKETLIGLGLSMDSAFGAEPYSETEESYPEPDRPHGEWVPIKLRPMTEEEVKEQEEKWGWTLDDNEKFMFDCPLPDEGKEILVSKKWGFVSIDTCVYDPDYGYGLEENGDWDGVTAWMPLPEPYKKGGEKE